MKFTETEAAVRAAEIVEINRISDDRWLLRRGLVQDELHPLRHGGWVQAPDPVPCEPQTMRTTNLERQTE